MSVFGNKWLSNSMLLISVKKFASSMSQHCTMLLNMTCFFFQEMNLLAEVDQPGSLIDNYVAQLSFLLSRKASGLVSLQARLARFQQRLKEQEILSRQKPLR